MRKLRIDMEKSSVGSTPVPLTRGLSAAAPAELLALDEKALQTLWNKYDASGSGSIKFNDLTALLRDTKDYLVAAKTEARKKAGKESESLVKAAAEIPIENLANSFASKRVDGKLRWADFKSEFTVSTLRHLSNGLARCGTD